MMVERIVQLGRMARIAIIVLACCHMVLGATLIGLQIHGISVDIISTHLGATGIWAGVFIIFSAIVGFLAAHLRQAGAIFSLLLLSVLSTFVSIAVVITSTYSLMEFQHKCEFGSASTHHRCQFEKALSHNAVELNLIVVATVEYILAASSVIICCWTLCCDPSGNKLLAEDIRRGSNKNTYSMEMETHEIPNPE